MIIAFVLIGIAAIAFLRWLFLRWLFIRDSNAVDDVEQAPPQSANNRSHVRSSVSAPPGFASVPKHVIDRPRRQSAEPRRHQSAQMRSTPETRYDDSYEQNRRMNDSLLLNSTMLNTDTSSSSCFDSSSSSSYDSCSSDSGSSSCSCD